MTFESHTLTAIAERIPTRMDDRLSRRYLKRPPRRPNPDGRNADIVDAYATFTYALANFVRMTEGASNLALGLSIELLLQAARDATVAFDHPLLGEQLFDLQAMLVLDDQPPEWISAVLFAWATSTAGGIMEGGMLYCSG